MMSYAREGGALILAESTKSVVFLSLRDAKLLASQEDPHPNLNTPEFVESDARTFTKEMALVRSQRILVTHHTCVMHSLWFELVVLLLPL